MDPKLIVRRGVLGSVADNGEFFPANFNVY